MTLFAAQRTGRLVRVVALLAAAAIAGCEAGGPAGTPPSDAESISTIVSYASGAITEPERFESYFVEGAAPDESQRLQLDGLMCIADADNVSVSGDSATAAVRFLDNNSQEIGTALWTLDRVGGQWKLKDIPLSEGVSAE